MEDGKLMCIGCRYLELDRDFRTTGRGVCEKTGEILEMPMLACDDYARLDSRHIPIPAWYREILTPTQANYMQALFDGLTITQIADRFDRTDQCVSVTIRRAKARIKEYRESMPGYADTDSITYLEAKVNKNAMYGMTAEEVKLDGR